MIVSPKEGVQAGVGPRTTCSEGRWWDPEAFKAMVGEWLQGEPSPISSWHLCRIILGQKGKTVLKECMSCQRW